MIRLGVRLLFLLGLVLFVAGAWQVKSTVALLAMTAHARGTVVAPGMGSQGPLIRFDTPDGQVIDFQQRGHGSSGKVGQTLGVLFVPANPALAPRVENLVDLWFGAALCGAAGLGCLLAAWYLARRTPRLRRA